VETIVKGRCFGKEAIKAGIQQRKFKKLSQERSRAGNGTPCRSSTSTGEKEKIYVKTNNTRKGGQWEEESDWAYAGRSKEHKTS